MSRAPSVLDGGTGNDTLLASFNDTLTGGEGADAMTLFFETALPDEDLGALVTDFTAGEDTLLIHCNGRAFEDDSFPNLRDDITVTETDEGIRILGRNGETIIELAGVTGLRIGFASDLGGSSFTDRAGAPIERADLDVIIRVYEETLT